MYTHDITPILSEMLNSLYQKQKNYKAREEQLKKQLEERLEGEEPRNCSDDYEDYKNQCVNELNS